jgi:hypothetical protein
MKKLDIHNHILPETWPDLKEVSVNHNIVSVFNFDNFTLGAIQIIRDTFSKLF